MIVFLLVSLPNRASGETLNGIIRDAKTNNVIPGATITVEPENKKTVFSGPEGKFVIDTNKERLKLTVKATGYRSASIELEVTKNEVITVELVPADQSEYDSDFIINRSEAPLVADPPTYDLSSEEIRTIPGGGNDALKTLQNLPGVARVPFGSGGSFSEAVVLETQMYILTE